MQSWSQTEIDDAVELVKKDPFKIKWMKKPPRVVQLAAVLTKPASIKFIRHTDVDIQLVAVEADPRYALEWIRHPHELAIIRACEKHGDNLSRIKNPTKEMIHGAVKQDGSVIRMVPEQSEVLQISALQNDPHSFGFFKSPSKRVRKMAVTLNALNIMHIRSPTVEEQVIAVTNDPSCFTSIRSPCVEAQVIAVRNKPTMYHYMRNPAEAVSIEFVKHAVDNIARVKNPSKAVKWSAIMNQPKSIKHIHDASEAMKATAIICG